MLLCGFAAATQECGTRECGQDASDDSSLLQHRKENQGPKEFDEVPFYKQQAAWHPPPGGNWYEPGQQPWMKPKGEPWWQVEQGPSWNPNLSPVPSPPPMPEPTTQMATAAPTPGPHPPCPYDFTPPACEDAEPQTPRNLIPGSPGEMIPKAATLNDKQAQALPLTNVHFHLGAEHKSESYNNGTLSEAYDAKKDPDGVAGTDYSPRPGWMCPIADLTADQMKPYEFKYCKKHVAVGHSYEVHYVHSSAGYDSEDLSDAYIDSVNDGLGGAANGRGQLNPMVVVEGQIFQIVNGGPMSKGALADGWRVTGVENAVMYPGSTTGTSFDNEVCSPYAITWHVDLMCHQISPESFDEMCQEMSERYGLTKDLSAHGSRILVDPAYVVKEEYVLPLA